MSKHTRCFNFVFTFVPFEDRLILVTFTVLNKSMWPRSGRDRTVFAVVEATTEATSDSIVHNIKERDTATTVTSTLI